jgi:glutamate 5-kinase
MGSKLVAAGTVKTAGKPVMIANGKRRNVIADLLNGVETGTLIVPAKRKMSSRSRWIGLTARAKGKLVVDDGAVKALRANKSLLAMGIVGVDGDFDSGDVVQITNKAGETIARGVSNYSHAEVELIKGHKSAEFGRLLKVDTYWDEVIHRDDLVVEAA